MNQHRFAKYQQTGYTVTSANVLPSSEAPEKDRKVTDLKFSYVPENYTDRPIVIGTRNGLLYKLMPSTRRGSIQPGMYIKMMVEVNRASVEFDAQNQLNIPQNNEQAALKDSRDRQPHTGTNNRLAVDCIFMISAEDIIGSGGVIYCPEVDMIFSILDVSNTILHPFSQKGLEYYEMLASDNLTDLKLAGVGIRLVDNEGVLKFKYLNFAGRVIRVPAHIDPTRPNGLYISINGATKSNENLTHPHYTEFIPLADFDKHDKFIFDTYGDAKSLGDMFKQREKEFKEREHALRERDLELTELRNQHAVEKIRIEEEIAKAKHTQTMELLEQQRLLKEKEFEIQQLKQELEREAADLKRIERELESQRKHEDYRLKQQQAEREQLDRAAEDRRRQLERDLEERSKQHERDMAEALRRVEEDRKRDEEQRKREADDRRRQDEREAHERKLRDEDLKRQSEYEKRNREREEFERKSQEERSSYMRKVGGEVLKYLPALISLATFILTQKQAKK